MLLVEILSADVKSRTWEFNGRKGTSRTQQGYAHVGKPFPVEVVIKLDERPAYAPGKYVTGPECFVLDQGQLTVRFTDLRESPRVASARTA